jgi:hypothetical protein
MAGWTTGVSWSLGMMYTQNYTAFLTIACFMTALAGILD